MNFRKLFALFLFVNACRPHDNVLTPAPSMLSKERLKTLLQLDRQYSDKSSAQSAPAYINALDLVAASCNDIHQNIGYFYQQCFEPTFFVRFVKEQELETFRMDITDVSLLIWTACQINKINFLPALFFDLKAFSTLMTELTQSFSSIITSNGTIQPAFIQQFKQSRLEMNQAVIMKRGLDLETGTCTSEEAEGLKTLLNELANETDYEERVSKCLLYTMHNILETHYAISKMYQLWTIPDVRAFGIVSGIVQEVNAFINAYQNVQTLMEEVGFHRKPTKQAKIAAIPELLKLLSIEFAALSSLSRKMAPEFVAVGKDSSGEKASRIQALSCLLYTSDAADE